MMKSFYTVLLFSLLFSQHDSIPDFSIGYGMGFAYACVGLNAEYEVRRNINLYTALGTVERLNGTLLSYSLGLHFYNSDKLFNYRTKGSIVYAKTTLFAHSLSDKYEELIDLLAISYGARWLWGKEKRFGIDYNIQMVIFDSYKDPRFKSDFIVDFARFFSASAGFRVRF